MAENVEIMGSDGTNAIKVKVDSSGNLITGGNVADDAAASGNPVPVGGIYNSTLPTYTALDRTQAQFGSRGSLNVTLYGWNSTSPIDEAAMNTDGTSALQHGLYVQSVGRLWNGATLDRQRNNNDLTVLSSAARTATLQSSDFTNYNGCGLHLVIDVTAIAATPSVVFTIQGKDAISGKYYTILASAAITGTGTTILRVFPGATAAANTVANDILPRVWRIDATHADADSITYSVGASVIL